MKRGRNPATQNIQLVYSVSFQVYSIMFLFHLASGLHKLIQEQAVYFTSSWPQVSENVFYAHAEILVIIID